MGHLWVHFGMSVVKELTTIIDSIHLLVEKVKFARSNFKGLFVKLVHLLYLWTQNHLFDFYLLAFIDSHPLSNVLVLEYHLLPLWLSCQLYSFWKAGYCAVYIGSFEALDGRLHAGCSKAAIVAITMWVFLLNCLSDAFLNIMEQPSLSCRVWFVWVGLVY